MFDDLDRTMQELLKRELPPSLVKRVSISFAAPDSQFPPAAVTLPAIDLFLYGVQQNKELRSSEWFMERQADGTLARIPPPVRVDCSYLVTAWANPSAPDPAADEHLMLGEVMKVLLRHATIPEAVLQGSLQGQEPPMPAISLQAPRLQSFGEFWQALGGKPKAALTYTVTIGVQPYAAEEAGPPVVDKMLKFRVETGVAL